MPIAKKTTMSTPAFKAFEALAKSLLAVPRQELQKKLAQEKLQKRKRKKVA